MTLPVPNSNAPVVDLKTGKLVPPWNSFFQQLVQAAPAVQNITLAASPFSYIPNSNGNLIVKGGVVSNITLRRGNDTIDLTGQIIIPTSINDEVMITYSGAPTVQFLGA